MSVLDDFRVLIRVRYAECDAQQVVFNARYGDYVDVAATELVRALFGSYQAVLEQGYDYQVVRLATDFRSPALFDDVLSIRVAVGQVGNSSFSFRLEFREHYAGRLVAESEIVYVMMQLPDYVKIPIPDFVRQRLAAGAPGSLINFAGVEV